MHCHECQNIMRQFIDGKVDSQTRKEVGLHLAVCEECSKIIEGDKFWDDALLSFLDCNAPEDLKSQILRDTVGQSESAEEGLSADSNQLSWRTNLKIISWAATRNSSPKLWLLAAAIFFGLLIFSYLLK